MTNTAVATEPKNGLTEQKKKSIVRRLFTRVWWLMFCTSYTKQQGTSTVWQLEPFIADIYGKDTDEYYDALQRHQNFFNTTPMFASFIYAIVISMEYERKAALDAGEEFDDNSIEAIKVALMGPIAGIGDSIQLSCLRVIATGVAIGFSQQGSWLGPILFALVYNVPNQIIHWFCGSLGMKLGTGFITEAMASGKMQAFTKGFTVLGMIMVGAMTASSLRSPLRSLSPRAVPPSTCRPCSIRFFRVLSRCQSRLAPLLTCVSPSPRTAPWFCLRSSWYCVSFSPCLVSPAVRSPNDQSLCLGESGGPIRFRPFHREVGHYGSGICNRAYCRAHNCLYGGWLLPSLPHLSRLECRCTRGRSGPVFAKIDGFGARFALSVFARERLRFIALTRRGDKDQMVEAFNGLMGLKLNDAQRSMVLADGFDGFAANGDRKHCHRILIEMPQAGMTEQQVKAYRRHFDIAVCHNGQMYRTELENKYATLSGRRRGYAAYLLSQIYSETNRKRSRDYREEASRLLGIPADQLTRRIHVNTTV